MEKTMEKIICPICESQDHKLFCVKNNYHLYRCRDCQLVFVYPQPEDVSQIYDHDYFHNKETHGRHGYTDYDNDKEAMRHVFVLYLQKLEKLVSSRKILDIGCATGYFLDLARARGWQTFGIEISEYAATEANKRGHSAQVSADLKNVQFAELDAITMWDVAEHLRDPLDYFARVNKILKSGGALAINTVDKSSFWARVFGKRWHMFIPPEHLLYYSPSNLSLMLSKSGFEVLEIKKIGKKFSLAYIFKILYGWQGLKIYSKFSDYFDKSFWRHLAIPINLRDNMFIIAKKTKDV